MRRMHRRTRIFVCLVVSAVTAGWVVPGAAQAVPVPTGAPTITGTPQAGQQLSVKQAAWTDVNLVTVTDQWQSCAGATCTTAATGGTYTVTPGDVGHTIQVLETATASDGSATALSTPTAVIAVGPGPSLSSAPSITGTLQQGNTLTVHQGTWTPTPASIADQWQRCTAAGASCTPVATGQTYPLTASDVGAALKVVETATDATTGGTSTSPTALTGVITTAAGNVPVPVNESPPTVSGQPEQGQTLVAANGAWSGNPASYSYQWERCSGPGCAAIPGATAQSYTAGPADVGQTLAVLETATNQGGAGRPAASARTRPVVATSVITFVASPAGPLTNQTVTMVATVGSGSGNANPSGSLTFFNGDTPIGNCGRQAFQSASQNVTLLCQTAFPAGTARLSAVFTPADGLLVAGSASQLTLDVGKDRTSTSLAVTKQVSRDRRAIYRATVVLPVSNSGPLDPTGSMAFFDRGRPIRGCLRRPVTRLAATCKVRYNAFGRHTISARYSGDANFGGSHSAARSVRIVNPASAPMVLGFIGSTLQWQFTYHPRYTLVTTLRANQVAKGSTLVLACSGSGCPFTQLAIPSGDASSINLLPEFHRHHLGVGSQITVRIIRQHWIGKYYSFTMRPGRGPQIVLSCLGVGRTRPGVGC
jgi:Bacterial Ig-like domain (group 3)